MIRAPYSCGLGLLTIPAAEFRGPGSHHRYDDSADDYDMDLDQRTRMLGGRSGRIILLGDGTEILTSHGRDDDDDDDDDMDMEDRRVVEELEDDDLPEQAKSGQGAKTNGEQNNARGHREETPAPGSQTSSNENKEPSAAGASTATPSSEHEPKIMAASDSIDLKTAAEQMTQK